MKIYEFYGKSDGTAICLGDFDGMHKGHREVFGKAAQKGDWGALLFTHNSKGEKEILTLSEKLDLLKKSGAKYAYAADFEGELKDKTPEEFVDILAEAGVAAAAIGYDYRFGRGASGDAELLKSLCEKKGIEVIVADAVAEDGEPVKSARIRELIKDGEIEAANRLLDSHYIISGRVEKGLGNGRIMGFPTANIAVPDYKLLPLDGVYKGSVCGRTAVINIGKNPTFCAEQRTVEVHILDEDKDLYGDTLTAEFERRLRGEIKFKNKEELISQIKKDIENAKGEK